MGQPVMQVTGNIQSRRNQKKVQGEGKGQGRSSDLRDLTQRNRERRKSPREQWE
jgi:hypothetical protein